MCESRDSWWEGLDFRWAGDVSGDADGVDQDGSTLSEDLDRGEDEGDRSCFVRNGFGAPCLSCSGDCREWGVSSELSGG